MNAGFEAKRLCKLETHGLTPRVQWIAGQPTAVDYVEFESKRKWTQGSAVNQL